MNKYKIFIAICMVAVVLISIIPQSICQESVLKDKAFSFLENVVGIDTAKYTIVNSKYSNNDPEITGISSEQLSYTLKLNDKEIKVSFRYHNDDEFVALLISEYNGSLASAAYVNKLPTNTIDATKEVLQRLRVHLDASYIQSISNSFNSVSDIKAVNATVDSIKRQVITYTSEVTPGKTISTESYTFSYVLNNATTSPKSVVISFVNGFLKGISIPWAFIELETDKIIITREQAIEIAKENAQSATTKQLSYRDDPIKAELTYITTKEAPSKAYPLWFVELPLNYPNSTITGWQAGIWANTGEIAYGHPAGNLGTIPDSLPTTESSNQDKANWQLATYAILITLAIMAIAIALVARRRFKK